MTTTTKNLNTTNGYNEQETLFINNAFYLLAHKGRIMSDSRLFLCPVAMEQGGKQPTLGAYLEWWTTTAYGIQTDKDGRRMLVYHLAGNPMSGSNSCAAVCEDGQYASVYVSSFFGAWASFEEIQAHYNATPTTHPPFTLQEVLDLLHEEDNGNTDYTHAIEVLFLSHEITALRQQIKRISAERNDWQTKYYNAITKLHADRILDYYARYEAVEKRASEEIQSIKAQRKLLKAQMQRGEIDSKTFQREVTPLNKRIHTLESEVEHYKGYGVREAFSDEKTIQFAHIEAFALANKSS